jgi:hypothetical protein
LKESRRREGICKNRNGKRKRRRVSPPNLFLTLFLSMCSGFQMQSFTVFFVCFAIVLIILPI